MRAEDEPLDLAQPRGKQDWHEEPHAIWYQRTTGIWQPVWLEPVGLTHITLIRWTPDVERGFLGLLVRLQRHGGAPLRMRVQLGVRGETLADDTCVVKGTELERQIAFDRTRMMDEDELLWSPEHPNLIDVVLTLLAGDEVIDEVQSYCGLRSIGTDGKNFLLNGHPYYLRLALEQGYWPQSHLAAPGDEALRREVELAKELGFNGVRIHQKALDPTRLTLGNEGFEHSIGDIYGIHDYSFEGSTLCERYGSMEAVLRTLQEVRPGDRALMLPGYEYAKGPLMLSEVGGISLRPGSDVSWHGYGTVADRDAFLSKYRELIGAILNSPAIAGFCYTQLTDTGQETNGLLTAEREPKLDPAAVRAITSSGRKK